MRCSEHVGESMESPFVGAGFRLSRKIPGGGVMQVGEFMESPFVGAGFQLSGADVLLEVPFDPKLDMLFVGEEILYSARLWTRGWDMYAPDMNLVWHHYNRYIPAASPERKDAGFRDLCCMSRMQGSDIQRLGRRPPAASFK